MWRNFLQSLFKTRDARMYALCGLDAIVVAAAATAVFFLRFPTEAPTARLAEFWWVIPLGVLVRIVLFWLFGLYNWVWYYMGMREVLSLVGAVTVASVVLGFVAVNLDATFPETLLPIDWLLVMTAVGGERLLIRLWRERSTRQALPEGGNEKKRILLVGAGDAAETISKEIKKRPALGYHLVGYTDDDSRKVGQKVRRVPVLGTIEDIPGIVSKHGIDEVIIAIPSASGEAMRHIVARCQESGVKFRTLPGLHQFIDGRVTMSQLREVEIEDLLRRDPYQPDLRTSGLYLRARRILVTGAAGSTGSELCRQIAGLEPALLVLFDWNENDLYEIELEMRERFPDLKMEVVVGDIKNKGKAEKVMNLFQPEVIFHAAAHKHVPLMEANPDEAVLNNILGTRVWIEAADRHGVERFVFISTDKAVNPTSVMGATKRVAEMMIQGQSGRSKTKFVAVRFGNVLGSRGSVVPLFRKQIAQGGPITVTHPEIVRYFMTVGEAVGLIIQAAALGKGGEIFVLDMGQPVKIVDLARDMIQLSGLKEGEDIEIKFIGLRPREKLLKEILTEMEGTSATRYEKIFLAKLEDVDREGLAQGIAELEWLVGNRDRLTKWIAEFEGLEGNKDKLTKWVAGLEGLEGNRGREGILRELKKLIPSYHPEGEG